MLFSSDLSRLDAFCRPSRWLHAGFVRYEHAEGWLWLHVRASEPVDGPDAVPLADAELEALFCLEQTRSLLARLAVTFAPYLPITAAHWEADLRQAPWPETLLRLWEPALDVYDYYTATKKLSAGAADDYFSLVVDFCNDPSGGFLRERRLRALKPGRAERVVAEMARWFHRTGSL